jgi:nitronate monooxygenase
MWPDRRLLNLLSLEVPIVQAPMAGSSGAELAAAVSAAGGLGSLPCAMLDTQQVRAAVRKIRACTDQPINLNFFCHAAAPVDPAREDAWRARLASYYAELGLDPQAPVPAANRAPFDAEFADAVAELKPAVASFHYGLPAPALLDRVKAAGCRVFSSATTVAEARWLEEHGADAIIAQGSEAGGHRGNFLADEASAQIGTLALVPQVVDAVKVPVIAAGGIADARGIAAAFALGAAGVQMGTAYLLCPEAQTGALHRAALKAARDDATTLTNVFTGRPARGFLNRLPREQGPLAAGIPQFPLAAGAVAPLRKAAEARGSADFTPMWAGQGAGLGRELPAGELTRTLAAQALARLAELAANRSAVPG